MTAEQLSRANLINEKIEKIDEIIEFLDRRKGGDEDPIQTIYTLCTQASNVGTSKLKKELGEELIKYLKDNLYERKEKLTKEFENL